MQIGGALTKYEKPDAGMFVGTIIDVIELGVVPSRNGFAAQERVRIVWVLDKNNSQGKPYFISEAPTTKWSDGTSGYKKSRLYEISEGVFGTLPPVPYDSELLIGKSNLLFLAKEGEFVKIKGFMPVPSDRIAPKAPSDFKRDKDDPVKRSKRLQRAQQALQQAQINAKVAQSITSPQIGNTETEEEEEILF